ncbi:MAG: M20/M25/M40 family metallo-hydrolase [Parachlamydiaceae bacterium]
MELSAAKAWVKGQEVAAIQLLSSLSEINSWSYNPQGIQKIRTEILKVFSPLNSFQEELETVLKFSKRMDASKKVLLGGHLDTVHASDSPFQACIETEDNLIGPGVTDMKGGLVALLIALEAFEQCDGCEKIGWQVLISSDEEIGSQGSLQAWQEAAKQSHIALLFEPSYPDGSFVSERMGSYNVMAEFKGRKAHAGRDFSDGRSANRAMAEWIYTAFREGEKIKGLQINAGEVKGGHAINVIPSDAFCKMNFRSFNAGDLSQFFQLLQSAGKEISEAQDVEVKVDLLNFKPPKNFSSDTKRLFASLEKAASALNQPFKTVATGGVCDGNTLQACGVPTIDTMGVIGGKIHTNEEYMVKKSLIERALLTLELLWNYAHE